MIVSFFEQYWYSGRNFCFSVSLRRYLTLTGRQLEKTLDLVRRIHLRNGMFTLRSELLLSNAKQLVSPVSPPYVSEVAVTDIRYRTTATWHSVIHPSNLKSAWSIRFVYALHERLSSEVR